MQPTPPPLPEQLVAYVEQLLTGTGLTPENVLAAAGGEVGTDALADRQVIEALRAGWSAADAVDSTEQGAQPDSQTETGRDRS